MLLVHLPVLDLFINILPPLQLSRILPVIKSTPNVLPNLCLLLMSLAPEILEIAGLMDAKARLGLQGTSSLLLLPPPLRPHLHTILISQAHRCPVRLVIIRGLLMTRELGRESALVLGEKVKLRGLHYV